MGVRAAVQQLPRPRQIGLAVACVLRLPPTIRRTCLTATTWPRSFPMNRTLARLLRSRSTGTKADRRTWSRVQAGIEHLHNMIHVALALAGCLFAFLCAAGNAMADDQQDIQDAIN